MNSLVGGADPRAPLFDQLSRRCRLVLHDRRGMGLSTGPLNDFSLDDDVDEAVAVLEAAGVL